MRFGKLILGALGAMALSAGTAQAGTFYIGTGDPLQPVTYRTSFSGTGGFRLFGDARITTPSYVTFKLTLPKNDDFTLAALQFVEDGLGPYIYGIAAHNTVWGEDGIQSITIGETMKTVSFRFLTDKYVNGYYYMIPPALRGAVLPVFFDIDIGTPGASTLDVSIASINSVPEPATWALLILGMGGVGWAMRRRHVVSETPSPSMA